MHLFLSPHFDDAVLSCGGTIHRLVKSGQRVIVRTVMGGAPPSGRIPDTAITRELRQRWAAGDNPVAIRAGEDEAAVGSLGAASSRLLNWVDCVYRTTRTGEPLYTTEASLFGAVHPDDIAGKLVPTLTLPINEPVRVVYVPMGVGHHVDHQIVRNWALELKKQFRWLALKFYEEYPYSKDENATHRALEFFAAHLPPIRLAVEMVRLNEPDVSAKVTAIRHYRSQLSTFWADETGMERAVRAAMVLAGGGEPAERYWSTE